MLEPAKRPSFPALVSDLQFLAKILQRIHFFKKINKNSLFQKKFHLHFQHIRINATGFTSHSEENNPSEKC